jgi:hypothetical protein
MFFSIAEADAREQLRSALSRCAVGRAIEQERKRDVFSDRKRRQQVEELKYEPDALATQAGERFFVERCEVVAVEKDAPARRAIHPAYQM